MKGCACVSIRALFDECYLILKWCYLIVICVYDCREEKI